MKNKDINAIIIKWLNILVLLGSLAIIVSLSYEILMAGNYRPSSQISLNIQLIVCTIFIMDFIMHWIVSDHKLKFVINNSVILLFAVPYMNLIYYLEIPTSNELHYILGFIPLLRGGYGLVVITSWFTQRNARSLMFSYLSILTATAYFTSLFFFIAEQDVNPEVHTYWDSLWWTGMTLATVGSNIVAVTPIGKVLSVIIAGAGMMLFPIFTVYITDKVSTRHTNRKSPKNKPASPPKEEDAKKNSDK